MFSVCILFLQLCLQCGGVYNVEMVNLQVEFGESVTLPCNGSAYLKEEVNVQWEAMGEDVAILRGGEVTQGDKFKDRVLLPSEEKLREGDWSVVLQHTMLSDSDMYECILQGRKTISTVWLTVMAPHVENSIVVPAENVVVLACYIQPSRNQSPNDLQVWWTRSGSTIVSTEKEAALPASEVYHLEDRPRIALLHNTMEEYYLHINPVMLSDSGEYQCLYKTRDSEDPRPGIPETITLTVLEMDPDIVFHPDDTTTATADWGNTSQLLITSWTEEVADAETTQLPLDLTSVLLEGSTQPIKVFIGTTESQQSHMTADEATLAPSPLLEGTSETSAEFPQWDTLPLIRIGLIAGVLLVTAVVLCILGALGKL